MLLFGEGGTGGLLGSRLSPGCNFLSWCVELLCTYSPHARARPDAKRKKRTYGMRIDLQSSRSTAIEAGFRGLCCRRIAKDVYHASDNLMNDNNGRNVRNANVARRGLSGDACRIMLWVDMAYVNKPQEVGCV